MTTFLFWNLMGNQQRTWPARKEGLRGNLKQMAASFQIDVFMFAESAFTSDELVLSLNEAKVGRYSRANSKNERIQIVTRFKPSALVERFNAIRQLTVGMNSVLLAVVHYESQMYSNEVKRLDQPMVAQNDIAITESVVGQDRTVLVGDFNMNPFDHGLVHARAHNAVMTREFARAAHRTVAQERFAMFYNPMWGFFGDRSPGPPGTYFYSASELVDYHWHMFDQVLLRPSLMDALKELRILDTDGTVSLLTGRGRPRKSQASDHSDTIPPRDLRARTRSMNSTAELDMWSDDIRVDVRTPLAILRIQENLLAKKTRGILQALVASTYLAEQSVQHQLDLFAPALGYRETLLTARHASDLVYPVRVSAKCFSAAGSVPALASGAKLTEWQETVGQAFGLDPTQREAATEEEFVEIVRKVLHSAEVRALIQSLIARSNELRPAEVPGDNSLSETDATPPSATANNDETN